MYVYCSIVHNSKDLEPTQMHVNGRLDKENEAYIHTMEYYVAINKNEFMSFAGTWMKLETIILSKPTQEQKTKHCMFLLGDLNNENTWTQGREHNRLGLSGTGGLGEG